MKGPHTTKSDTITLRFRVVLPKEALQWMGQHSRCCLCGGRGIPTEGIINRLRGAHLPKSGPDGAHARAQRPNEVLGICGLP